MWGVIGASNRNKILNPLWTTIAKISIVLAAAGGILASKFKIDSVELVVQVNGKLRARIQVANGASNADIEQKVRLDSKVQQALNNAPISKMIIVPGKLVNVVTAK